MLLFNWIPILLPFLLLNSSYYGNIDTCLFPFWRLWPTACRSTSLLGYKVVFIIYDTYVHFFYFWFVFLSVIVFLFFQELYSVRLNTITNHYLKNNSSILLKKVDLYPRNIKGAISQTITTFVIYLKL